MNTVNNGAGRGRCKGSNSFVTMTAGEAVDLYGPNCLLPISKRFVALTGNEDRAENIVADTKTISALVAAAKPIAVESDAVTA